MDAPKPARFPRALLAKVPASVMHDEALQAKRKAVVRDMSQAFDALLRPLGFVRSGSHWCKVSAEGTSAFHFQKSQYGFDCFLNVSAKAAIQASLPGTGQYRLASFCPELSPAEQPDGLSYVRLHDDVAYQAAVMHIFAARMLPWMMALHPDALPHHPKPVPSLVRRCFGKGPWLRHPKPEDMQVISVFAN